MEDSPKSVEKDYVLSAKESHHRTWDSELEPRLTVESGSIVQFDCQPGAGDAITPKTTAKEAASKPFPGHVLTGPVAIDNTEPGDVLEIDFLDIAHGEWGHTLIPPGEDGQGLLPEEFEKPYLYHWDLEDKTAEFVDGIEIPLTPFPGTVGVAPDKEGTQSTIPPRQVGGNMDIKYLTEGSKLFLPIEISGGLLSMGDGHAAQGDGEVCLTAIETELTVKAKLTVRSDMSITTPQFCTQTRYLEGKQKSETYGTVGIGESLLDASKEAIREMILHLESERGLDRYESYVLCSVVVDLAINEVVNDPNWVVTASIPESIFPSKK